MLNVKNVCAGYEGLQIVNDVTIKVPDTGIVSIVGSNGVGKTTLLKSIVGLLPLMNGEIQFNDEKISGLPVHEILNRGIVLIPEGRQLFSNMTVEENLKVGSCTKKNRLTRSQNLEKVYSILPKLKERSKQLAGTLSGGEQQMVATARALMSNPKLLIMDEPSWGLAPILVDELFETIETINKEGTAILIIEQNVAKTLALSSWSYVIEQGSVVLEGVGKDLICNEELKKAFLGI